MTLHEAILQVLLENGHPMTAKEIANALNQNSWYTKGDNSPIKGGQISARVNNYPHLFNKDGPTISLKRKTGIGKVGPPAKPKASISKVSTNPSLANKTLMNEKNFKPAKDIDIMVLDEPGLYCIRIQDTKQLPDPFDQALTDRKHNIIYIGIASQSLKKRMLGQELRAKGHGTFFRSLGAVLGKRPEPGSLRDKKNKNNYTFSPSNEKKIIAWINKNLLVNWVTIDGDLKAIEDGLIKEHLPLLNIAGNPGAMPELTALRDECKKIGRG